MQDRTRGRSKKNVKQGLPWLDQVKTFYKASASVPAKLFLEDIFVPTKGGKITNDSFSEEALDLLTEIVRSKAEGPGKITVEYEDYNKFGSELSANFFGVEENQNPDLISRLANINPADELKFTLGTATVEIDDKGRAKVDDQYDFNTWAYYGEGLNENGKYNIYTPEEFEELGIGFTEAVKDTLANSPSLYQATRNMGFLLGSKDYADDSQDKGKKVEVDLGTVMAPNESSVKTSPRPAPRKSKNTQVQKLEEELRDTEEDLKTSMLPAKEDPDLSDLRKYLENLPEGPAEVTSSPRPMPRPEADIDVQMNEMSLGSVETSPRPRARPSLSEPDKKAMSGSVETSPRPKPRPAAEPQADETPNTDEMSFSEAFKYYTDNTDQDVFTWRGKDYKAERAYNKGGLIDQTENLFKEGGMVDDGMERDPVSGNEIPPGSTAEEVRDTVDAKLSEGEYVVPADVVQYYGVKFFEDLRSKAKVDLKNMEDRGRIGGEPVEDLSEDLTPEEMAMLQEAMSEEPIKMAEGGFVKKPAFMGNFGRSGFETRQYIDPDTGVIRSFMFLDGEPVVDIPDGFVPYTDDFKKQQEEKKKQEQEVKTEGTRSDSDDANSLQRADSREDKDTSWNPGVDLTDPDKALEYAKSQADMSFGQKAAGVGAMLGGPLGLAAGAFSAGSQLESISNIRAAAQIQQATGNTETAKKIMDLTKGFKIEGGLIDDIFASGKKKSYSYMTDPSLGGGLAREMFKSEDRFERSLQKNAPTGMTWTGSSYQAEDDDPGVSFAESVGNRLGGKRIDTSDEGTPVFEPTKDTPRPQGRPGSSRPASRPSSKDDDDDSQSGGGGFGVSSPGYGGLYNKGGLVKRPTKTQKKRPARTKGLASRSRKK